MKLMDWKFIQERSNEILSDGIFKLKNQPLRKVSEIISNNPGNYLISKEETSYYIGEGKVLEKRLKQQFSPNISTFYKTYLKSNLSLNIINRVYIQ